MDFTQLGHVAATQHGVLTSSDLVAAGVSRRTMQGLVSRGVLRRVHGGVYVLAGVSPPLQRHCAGLRAAGAGSVLSHRSGMTIWGVPGIVFDTIEVLVGRGRYPRTNGVIIRRSRDLAPSHVAMVDALAVTNPARTLVDVAGVVRPFILDRALERWLTDKLVTIDEIEAMLDEIARPGRTGVVAARAMLERRALGRSVSDSALEVLTAKLLRSAGLEVVHHHLVTVGSEIVAELDFAFPAERVYIESDGFGAHTTRHAFDRDRQRQNLLSELDWMPVRFSDRQLRNHGRESMGSVHRILAMRRRELADRQAS